MNIHILVHKDYVMSQRSHIKSGLGYIKIIVGPTRITHDNDKTIDQTLLDSNLNDLGDIYIYIYMRKL